MFPFARNGSALRCIYYYYDYYYYNYYYVTLPILTQNYFHKYVAQTCLLFPHHLPKSHARVILCAPAGAVSRIIVVCFFNIGIFFLNENMTLFFLNVRYYCKYTHSFSLVWGLFEHYTCFFIGTHWFLECHFNIE